MLHFELLPCSGAQESQHAFDEATCPVISCMILVHLACFGPTLGGAQCDNET